MKTESSSVDKRRDTLRHREKAIRKKCGSRPIRNPASKTCTVVQKLFDTCKDIFKGPDTVPPPQDVHKLQRILDKVKPEDFGLSKNLAFFKSDNVIKGTPSITYTTVYKSEKFSMCIFFLPPTGVIPFHNHPGMTVFSKLLLGSMHIKAYDWVDPAESLDSVPPSSQSRLASLEVDRVFTAPCNTSILYPSAGGNIHTFRAVTPCAVLDVLGPPYSIEEDRDCTYYRELPYNSSSDKDGDVEEGKCSYGWLEEIEIPEDLKMEGVEYLGPQIDDGC